MLHVEVFTISWPFKKSRALEYSYNLSIVILYISPALLFLINGSNLARKKWRFYLFGLNNVTVIIAPKPGAQIEQIARGGVRIIWDRLSCTSQPMAVEQVLFWGG
jgi:hypothetical protein